ncbi:hypothetical protein [Sphingobacterium sp. SGR-19]|uniref:hypothetical protein n=1 Tax=Sphingobacterium sp. SGR-19 TaxID=2710886 RepID=UPI0013EE1DE5|nr:hypothetical protein [Sphingobacterium sp. SGR-19]NGM65795.1 hypothetical protein [Sphingobacterium sp. SGR-19]
MATLNIKALSAGISLFALFMVGTISAKANTHEGGKKENEVKAKTEKVVLAPQWYEFTDNLNDGDASNPLNYTLTPNAGQNPPSCPTGEDQVCAVHAQPDQDNPDIPDLSSGSIVETRMKAE